MGRNLYLPRTVRCLGQLDSQPALRQHMLHYVAPLDHNHYLRISGYFGQLIGHNAGFV
jgi:hypothetical protein